jgi:circadian clock protein KaiC
MVDLLKSNGITAMLTSLSRTSSLHEITHHGLSSLMDAWVSLMDIETNGERNRVLYVIKARGICHSNQIREYRMTDTGIELIDPCIGSEGVLTGTARILHEAREQAAAERRRQDLAQRRRVAERRQAALERQILELQATLEAERAETDALRQEEEAQDMIPYQNRLAIAAHRKSPS